MGFFDKLKGKAKQVAGDALQTAVETAKDKVKDAVSDQLAGAAEQATGGALGRLGVAPDSVAAGAAKAATDVAVETGVRVASDEVDGAQGNGAQTPGEPQAG